MTAPFDLEKTNCKRAPAKIQLMTNEDGPDWHLQEWMAHFGKRQAALVNELGWTKNRAHFVWHSSQRYRRDDVNTIASWLGIKPFELLMSPREALALRRLRQSAAAIVAESEQQPFDDEAGAAQPAGRAPRN